MRVSLMPMARAASTNGISRNDRVLERMTRATLGTSGMAMAMMVLGSDGPSEAAMTSAMTSSGSDCMMSIRRCTRRSNQPPKKPDISPMATPIRQPSAVAPTRDHQRDARAIDDAAEDVAAHEVGTEQMAVAGRGQGGACVGRERVVGGDGVGKECGRHEQDHDQRADGAQRIAAHEEQRGATPAADVGSRPRQLDIVIDDRHLPLTPRT